MAEVPLAVAAVVLVVLGLGQAETEDAAVGIDAVAAEAGELVDRGLRDALAERVRRLWWSSLRSLRGLSGPRS